MVVASSGIFICTSCLKPNLNHGFLVAGTFPAEIGERRGEETSMVRPAALWKAGNYWPCLSGLAPDFWPHYLLMPVYAPIGLPGQAQAFLSQSLPIFQIC